METWYKLSFPYKECGIGGKGQGLQDNFLFLLIRNGGKPWSAALFSQHDADYENVVYYFTPDAYKIAGSLIEGQRAVPCDQPPFPTIENRLRLAVGDARIFEILWPEDYRKDSRQ
ncbi:MAG: hypothetical protein WCB53_17950 [Terriglobales bacterium]